MDVSTVSVDRAEARRLYRKYKEHRAYSNPIDWEIQRTYQLLAQGNVVIRAIESIKLAGLHTEGRNAGLPKLALCRADAKSCFYRCLPNGSATFSMDRRVRSHHARRRVALPAGSIPGQQDRSNSWNAAEAVVPLIPVDMRPRRAMASYHILWEAEWTRIPPHDPYLLRRIGGADLWLVVAHWDLTEVERGALATRVAVQ